MQKPESRLENWAVVASDYSPYTAPEAIPARLTGKVYGHKHTNNLLPDGMEVTTSRLVSVDFKARVAETRNTIYHLGTPNPDWIAAIKRMGSDLERYGLEEVTEAAQ